MSILKGEGHIDAHQHFWKYNEIRDSWISTEMEILRKDFLPADLKPILETNGFEGCITVQSDQSEDENRFQLENADKNYFIKGIVGWVDFQADNIEERLGHFSQYKKLKGFRHILQGESKRDFMLQSAFLKGIGLLKNYDFTYDILVFPDQLTFVEKFVSKFPDQRFVINHIGKPNIKAKKLSDWENDIKAIARQENVFCKISGMITEADWQTWKREDFSPFIDVIVNAFGTKRIMFGSDWPVCLLAATYEQTVLVTENYFKAFSQTEYGQFFGGNAKAFYQL